MKDICFWYESRPTILMISLIRLLSMVKLPKVKAWFLLNSAKKYAMSVTTITPQRNSMKYVKIYRFEDGGGKYDILILNLIQLCEKHWNQPKWLTILPETWYESKGALNIQNNRGNKICRHLGLEMIAILNNWSFLVHKNKFKYAAY